MKAGGIENQQLSGAANGGNRNGNNSEIMAGNGRRRIMVAQRKLSA
jgi:hypothetical protein